MHLYAREFDRSIFVDRLRDYVKCVMASGRELSDAKNCGKRAEFTAD